MKPQIQKFLKSKWHFNFCLIFDLLKWPFETEKYKIDGPIWDGLILFQVDRPIRISYAGKNFPCLWITRFFQSSDQGSLGWPQLTRPGPRPQSLKFSSSSSHPEDELERDRTS